MRHVIWFSILVLFLYACGGPTLHTTVRYARLSVNTVMLGAQEADEVNGAFFEETSERITQEAYEEVVRPVAAEYGLEGEENVCGADLGLLGEVDGAIKDACDLGYATWCKNIQPVWEDHCLRTCIVGTTKDGLKTAEKVVDGMQYVQEQYSADSYFKQLKEEHRLQWTDYLNEFKEWFEMGLGLLGNVVHLLHDADVDLPPALYTVVDVSGMLVNIPENDALPACVCAAYPTGSECEEAVKLLED